jgi:hypothetical protein
MQLIAYDGWPIALADANEVHFHPAPLELARSRRGMRCAPAIPSSRQPDADALAPGQHEARKQTDDHPDDDQSDNLHGHLFPLHRPPNHVPPAIYPPCGAGTTINSS